MPHDSDKADSPESWMAVARGDLAMARIDLPLHATYEMLCFHAQQAAEKSIKALLAHLGIDFPYTHNIAILVALLPSDLQSVSLLREAERLTPYAVLTRYPGEKEPVDEERYRRLVGIAAAVVEWVQDYVSRHG
ncbi:MAG: HEPN domain-containing protein [Armatimonadota bacterium]|nr:HEPN domain-containing protein [Armatimonadota bacterium]